MEFLLLSCISDMHSENYRFVVSLPHMLCLNVARGWRKNYVCVSYYPVMHWKVYSARSTVEFMKVWKVMNIILNSLSVVLVILVRVLNCFK
jgi:hypothetical protein